MWKCHTHAKPVPVPDEDSLIFWEGCRRQRLLIQQCDACRTFRFPPSPLCPQCLDPAVTWRQDPGRGVVQTFCIYHVELAGPAWKDDLPYVVAVVRLDASGVNMLSNVLCDDPQSVQVGTTVQVIFAPAGPDHTLPKFIVCEEEKASQDADH